MTPDERAAALIGRINETTDTASLERMIAEEIRAAEEGARAPEAAHGGFNIVRHKTMDSFRDDSPFMRSLEQVCYLCGVDESEPGKTTLYLTDDGYHCESCMYDEYMHLRTKHLSLFAVEFQTVNEVRHALIEEFSEDEESYDEELYNRLAMKIAADIKSDEYLKAFPDIIHMLMRRVYYRTLRRHKGELPAGFELPPAEADF